MNFHRYEFVFWKLKKMFTEVTNFWDSRLGQMFMETGMDEWCGVLTRSQTEVTRQQPTKAKFQQEVSL